MSAALLGLLVSTIAAAAPAPVLVRATPSRGEASVGEPFTIELRASGPAGTRFSFPAEVSTGSFDLRSPAPVEGEAGSRTASPAPEPGAHRYQAMVFGVGSVEIPALPVRYRLPDGSEGEAASAPLTIKVTSLLPKDPAERKLADVRGPLPASIGRAFWIALALALAAFGGIAFLVYRRLRRRRGATPVAPAAPVLPADAEALRALDALAAGDLAGRGEYRLFYIELAAIAKRYLERRLEAPVVEMTSAETLAFLRGHRHGGELLPIVRDLAEAADRVKFANAEGFLDEARRHVAAVRRLVEALEARLRPVAVVGQGEAA